MESGWGAFTMKQSCSFTISWNHQCTMKKIVNDLMYFKFSIILPFLKDRMAFLTALVETCTNTVQQGNLCIVFLFSKHFAKLLAVLNTTPVLTSTCLKMSTCRVQCSSSLLYVIQWWFTLKPSVADRPERRTLPWVSFSLPHTGGGSQIGTKPSSQTALWTQNTPWLLLGCHN